MKSFPTELVLKVSEHLTSNEKLNLQATNTTLRENIFQSVWKNVRINITDGESSFDQDSLEPPQTDLVFNISIGNIKGLLNMVEDYEQFGYPLQELRHLSIQCSSESLTGGFEKFLKLANQELLPKLKRVDIYSRVKIHQPTILFDFLNKFDNITANLYLDSETALEPVLIPGNVNKLILSTIKGTEKFDLHDVIHSSLLNNVESLHLLTDKNHPITKNQLMKALENSELKSLTVTPHCVESEDDNLHWTLPGSITDFQLHVPSFDQEWSPSLGSITSDKLQSLRVPSNGENRLYNMRFPNLKQLHLEGTIKDAFKLPPGIELFCETSTNLHQLQLSGFSMSDVSQIVNQFQYSLKSVILQNTASNGREYNVYQWNYLPQLEFLVVDYSPLASNTVRTTKRLLEAGPRTVKMYIIDHKDMHDESLWCSKLDGNSVLYDGISEIDLLEGVDHDEWSAYELDRRLFMQSTPEVEL